MPMLIIILVLIALNWLCSILFMVNGLLLLRGLGTLGWWGLGLLLLGAIAWCVGDDP